MDEDEDDDRPLLDEGQCQELRRYRREHPGTSLVDAYTELARRWRENPPRPAADAARPAGPPPPTDEDSKLEFDDDFTARVRRYRKEHGGRLVDAVTAVARQLNGLPPA